jgi:plasmid maintenance system killer protein
MDIEFLDSRLGQIETEDAAKTSLPVSLIQAIRVRLRLLRAAPDMKTIENWKSLGLSNDVGKDIRDKKIKITHQWDLIFRHDVTEAPNKLSIVDLVERLESAA